MKKIFLICVLSAIFFSGCVQPNSDGNGNITPENGATYTLEKVSVHDNENDCWLAISGKVYNATSFVAIHPGGQAILQGCGKDATTLFETRPTGSGTPHSANARNMLERYYIGEVK
jgi:cytochrome b involved in lipid metabolism